MERERLRKTRLSPLIRTAATFSRWAKGNQGPTRSLSLRPLSPVERRKSRSGSLIFFEIVLDLDLLRYKPVLDAIPETSNGSP